MMILELVKIRNDITPFYFDSPDEPGVEATKQDMRDLLRKAQREAVQKGDWEMDEILHRELVRVNQINTQG